MALACPNCSQSVEVAPGLQVGCPRCGVLVGQPVLARVAPDARSFSERIDPGAVRFVSRSSPVLPIVFGMLGLVLIVPCFLALDPGAPLVAYFIMPMLPLGAFGVALLTLVHYSEVTIDRAAVTIRSFPFPHESSGRYPRELVLEPGWVKIPGPRGGYRYSVRLALRDRQSLLMPFEVGGEAHCAYVVERLRSALAR